MDFQNTLTTIGEASSGFMTKVVQFLANLGLTLNNTQGKILNFIIIVGLALAAIKLIHKPIKWIFVILLVLLALSIGLSFIPTS